MVPPPSGLVCPAGTGAKLAVYTLYFGTSMANRPDLTAAEWQHFVDDTITAALPDGFTVWDAKGAWRDPGTGRTAQEPTKVLSVALPPGDAGLAAVDAVRTAYEHRFAQQVVGMTVAPACGTFAPTP